MMSQLKVTELGLDDSGQLQQINRVAGENDVRSVYVHICRTFPCMLWIICISRILFVDRMGWWHGG